ncbi:von Willebrand factor type A domain protein [Planctomycetes bacterium Pla163]|uniref:von Willebrand factor type A domain protein n=1 Tax=Rohdeia mirabilis TaxID=2528008 RepID=A0A518D0R7_9BACT|nr:von Willebrand factor type A domain protein [Planctomycetes bacterium Pla163]
MSVVEVFEHPVRLSALAFVPVAFVLLRWLDHRAAARRVRDFGRASLAFAPPRGRSAAARAFALVGLAACVVAAADPRFGRPVVPIEERGIDLVLCLDVSRSMGAQDVRPHRLAAARSELETLVERAANDRIALVAFAGDARLVAAPTTDARSLLESLRALDTDDDLAGGTDLGAALEVAANVLASRRDGDDDAEAEASRPAAVVLVTDGEDHGGSGREVAERLAEREVAVHVIGVGSERGAKIPNADGTGFVRDRDGVEVVTALGRTSLESLVRAGAAGSSLRFVESERGSAGRALANGPLADLARADLGDRERRERPVRFQWFLGAGLACLLLGRAHGGPSRMVVSGLEVVR